MLEKYFNLFKAILVPFARGFYGQYCLLRLRSRYPSVNIEGPSKIKFDNIDALNFGRDVRIGAFSEIVVIETSSSTSIRGHLKVGDRVVIGKGANIRAAGGEIYIGEGALLAQNVSLIAANHLLNPPAFYRDEPWDSQCVGVVVNRNVWIGTGVIVLPGVVIGENSVIAAGAVVTKNIPCNEVWAGVPARCIKRLGRHEISPL